VTSEPDREHKGIALSPVQLYRAGGSVRLAETRFIDPEERREAVVAPCWRSGGIAGLITFPSGRRTTPNSARCGGRLRTLRLGEYVDGPDRRPLGRG